MKQFILTTTLLLCLTSFTCGQNKTHFGLEFSVANDIYKIHDNGNYLISVPLINGLGGFNLRQDIGRYIFIEAGLTMKYYQQGFGFKTIPYYGTWSSDPSLIIPLRLGFNLRLYKEIVYLVPVVGYSLGINPPFGYGVSNGKQTSSTTTIDYSYTENSDASRYFSLLQAGIGFDFKLFRTLLFSVSTNYYSGYNRISRLDINYTVNNSNQLTGTATTKASFWCISTGLKYPISNFWTKK